MCDARALKKSKLDVEQIMDGLERMLATHPPTSSQPLNRPPPSPAPAGPPTDTTHQPPHSSKS